MVHSLYLSRCVLSEFRRIPSEGMNMTPLFSAHEAIYVLLLLLLLLLLLFCCCCFVVVVVVVVVVVLFVLFLFLVFVVVVCLFVFYPRITLTYSPKCCIFQLVNLSERYGVIEMTRITIIIIIMLHIQMSLRYCFLLLSVPVFQICCTSGRRL